MKKLKILKTLKISLVIVSFVLLFNAYDCLAISSIVDTSGNYASGNYTLNDVGNYAVYIMKIILSLVGTLSLLAFIYGGITFLLSAGSSEKVKKGMDIIKAAIVGLIITFASVLIMNLFFGGIGVGWNAVTGEIKISGCAQFSDQGYSCMNVSSGKNCKTGLCPGDATNKCCQPK